MSAHSVRLREVDEVRVTSIVDNAIDLVMDGTEVVKRLDRGASEFEKPWPIAEHGFSALVSVRYGDRWKAALLDTGCSPSGILHNLDVLSIDLSPVETIILSHGHFDHTSGLSVLLERLGPRRVRLVAHPDAFLERRKLRRDGVAIVMPSLSREALRRDNVELIETTRPTLLMDGQILVSGEIARTTDFELGMPRQQARRDGVWQPDPLVRDDQCIVINLRGMGLVVITGCGHAGIVNTLRHIRALTGVERVHALIGGFHLVDRNSIAPSVAALQEIGPRYVVPTHCTGWAAIHEIARAMSDAFIANSVGTTFVFKAAVQRRG